MVLHQLRVTRQKVSAGPGFQVPSLRVALLRMLKSTQRTQHNLDGPSDDRPRFFSASNLAVRQVCVVSSANSITSSCGFSRVDGLTSVGALSTGFFLFFLGLCCCCLLAAELGVVWTGDAGIPHGCSLSMVFIVAL